MEKVNTYLEKIEKDFDIKFLNTIKGIFTYYGIDTKNFNEFYIENAGGLTSFEDEVSKYCYTINDNEFDLVLYSARKHAEMDLLKAYVFKFDLVNKTFIYHVIRKTPYKLNVYHQMISGNFDTRKWVSKNIVKNHISQNAILDLIYEFENGMYDKKLIDDDYMWDYNYNDAKAYILRDYKEIYDLLDNFSISEIKDMVFMDDTIKCKMFLIYNLDIINHERRNEEFKKQKIAELIKILKK